MGVLVVGGTGFIGGHLSRALLSRLGKGDDLVLYDLYPNIEAIRDIKEKVVVQEGDVLDFPKLLGVFKKHHISKVVHLAVFMRGAETDLYRATMTNIVGFQNLLEACRLYDVDRLVWASSVALYGTPPKGLEPVDEEYPPNPDTVYGMCKMYEEFFARRYFRNYGLRSIAIRPSMVFGPMRYYRPALFNVDIFENPPRGLPVSIGEGELNREIDWVYVKDVTLAFSLALESKAVDCRVYNLGGETKKVKEILAIVKKYIPSTEVIIKPDDMSVSSELFPVSWNRIRTELGYSPQYGLERGIKDYADVLRGS